MMRGGWRLPGSGPPPCRWRNRRTGPRPGMRAAKAAKGGIWTCGTPMISRFGAHNAIGLQGLRAVIGPPPCLTTWRTLEPELPPVSGCSTPTARRQFALNKKPPMRGGGDPYECTQGQVRRGGRGCQGRCCDMFNYLQI